MNLYCSPNIMNHQLVEAVRKKTAVSEVVSHDGERHPGNGILLTKNRGNFLKPCPGQKGHVCCGYQVVEWGLGCIFKCEYCVLQKYIHSGDLILYTNWEDCFNEISRLRQTISGPIRIGTGEFGDSLAIEDFFPFNSAIIDFTANLGDIILELKTKSANINALRERPRKDHVVVAFSLNPQSYIDAFEHGTASLAKRLDAAAQVAVWGYNLAFHFDPIIARPDWETSYQNVISILREKIPAKKVKWISIGTFRFPKGFQEIAEIEFPKSDIFAEEFYPSADGKMRYFRPFREKIYKFIIEKLGKSFPDSAAYICMESPDVWERATGKSWCSAALKSYLDSF